MNYVDCNFGSINFRAIRIYSIYVKVVYVILSDWNSSGYFPTWRCQGWKVWKYLSVISTRCQQWIRKTSWTAWGVGANEFIQFECISWTIFVKSVVQARYWIGYVSWSSLANKCQGDGWGLISYSLGAINCKKNLERPHLFILGRVNSNLQTWCCTRRVEKHRTWRRDPINFYIV